MKLKQSVHKFLRWSEKYTKVDMVYLLDGFFWLNFDKIISIFLGFVSVIAFANLVPKEVFGQYKYVLSVVGILVIFTLPSMGTAIIQAVARGYDGSIIPTLKIRLKWGVLGVMGSLMLAAYYYLNENLIYAWAFVIAAIFLSPVYSLTIYQAYLKGKKKFKELTNFSIANQIVCTAVLIAALFFTDDVFLILLAFFVPQLILNSIVFCLILKKYPPNKKEDSKTLSYGKYLNAVSIIGVVSQYIDKIIVGAFMGPINLAVYFFATALPEKLIMLFEPIAILALSKFSDRTEADLKRYIPKKVLQSFLVTIPVTIAYIVICPILYKTFFPQYLDSIFYSQVFALIILFEGNRLMSTYFTAKIRKREILLFNVAAPTVKILLMVILMPFYQIMGMIAASVLAQAFYFFYLLFLFYRQGPEKAAA